MEDLEMSGEKKYAMTVFENISIIAYARSFLIFGISFLMFHDLNELAIKITGIFFIIGAVFAAMSSFIICSLPVSFHLQKEETTFTKEDMEEIKDLMDEFDILDEKENEK